MTLPRGRSGL